MRVWSGDLTAASLYNLGTVEVSEGRLLYTQTLVGDLGGGVYRVGGTLAFTPTTVPAVTNAADLTLVGGGRVAGSSQQRPVPR